MRFGTRSCCKYDVCDFPIEGFTVKRGTRKLKYYTNEKRKGGSKRALLCPNQDDGIEGITFNKKKNGTKKLVNMRALNKWCNIRQSRKKYPITKIIWILWFQGFESAPPIVKKCLDSWVHHNKDWKIVALDENNLSKYIDIDKYISKDTQEKISRTCLSDIVRLLLLKLHGGIWIDATNYCMKPLDSWIYQYAKEGFFVFSRDGYGPGRVVGSWFIYAEKGNYLLDKWLLETLDFWERTGKKYDYHWLIILFFNLCKNDAEFKEKWEKVPKFSAIGPFGPLAFNKGKFGGRIYTDIDENQIYNFKNKMAPFYKTTWKDHDKASPNSVINYFLKL